MGKEKSRSVEKTQDWVGGLVHGSLECAHLTLYRPLLCFKQKNYLVCFASWNCIRNTTETKLKKKILNPPFFKRQKFVTIAQVYKI